MPAFPSPGSQQAPPTSSSLTFALWVQEEGDICDGSLSCPPSLFGALFGKLGEHGSWRVSKPGFWCCLVTLVHISLDRVVEGSFETPG